jgi:hypothetical protein
MYYDFLLFICAFDFCLLIFEFLSMYGTVFPLRPATAVLCRDKQTVPIQKMHYPLILAKGINIIINGNGRTINSFIHHLHFIHINIKSNPTGYAKSNVSTTMIVLVSCDIPGGAAFGCGAGGG